MVYEQRTLLTLSKRRSVIKSWHRAVVVPRSDSDYATWERWCACELFWLHNACFTPGKTPAQLVHDATMFVYHFNRAVRVWEEKMAKNGDSKKGTIAVNRWVNMRLDDDDKAAITNEAPPLSDILASFGALVFSGYRLSLSWDAYSNACQASLVGATEECPNAGIGVSARHPDADMAFITLAYKVSKMGDEPWESFVSPTPKGSWG